MQLGSDANPGNLFKGTGRDPAKNVVPGRKVTVKGADDEDSRVKGVIKFCAVKFSQVNGSNVDGSVTGSAVEV